MPQLAGSISPRAAFVAMAASTQLPPALSTSTPTSAASGWLAQTMPCWAITAERSRLRAARRAGSRGGRRAWGAASAPLRLAAADTPVRARKLRLIMGLRLSFRGRAGASCSGAFGGGDYRSRLNSASQEVLSADGPVGRQGRTPAAGEPGRTRAAGPPVPVSDLALEPLQRLAFGWLSLQEEGLWQPAFSTYLEGAEVLDQGPSGASGLD